MSREIIKNVPDVPAKKRIITDAPSEADPQDPHKRLIEPNGPKGDPLVDIPPSVGQPLNE